MEIDNGAMIVDGANQFGMGSKEGLRDGYERAMRGL